MPRRKDSILTVLMILPWWVSVLLSVLAYIGLAVVLPAIEFQSQLLKGLQSGLPNLALMLSFILLIPAPVSAFNAWRKRKLLDTQKNVATIRDLSWREFEELVAEAYRRQGFQVIENHKGGADGGVDIRLKKDDALYLIQCKQWKSQKIGVSVVRELFGVMTAEQATSASVVCSGIYTQEAKNFAAGKNIDLVDGPQLEAMIKQVQRMPQQKTASKNTTISPKLDCPQCGNKLLVRKARKGKNAGNEFYGCSTFPSCRYTKSI